MRRIAVVGAGGAGKTVLANQLGARLGIPVTHLDALRYDTGWNLIAEDEFAARQRAAVAADRWITDGNSLATLPIRAAAAAAVIVVDPPPLVCLWGILQRRWRYRGGQHADGVFDRITWFFLRYVILYRRRHLPRTLACIAQHGPHATVVHLTSRRQAENFVAQLSGQEDGR
ncbi:topology modulation protein [Actinoplanes couchii]|uniref:DNA topology modulation protein FlaR n=1 Tax=Actinoplanes couchii TaxID=403638 RepID=A0ABQ3XSZ5_9ACTN|nr:topology modulation protein [Actinoplanes couchii]MDR6324099.1 adenylate kinase family enzyme [Actinoplanes couchii]GID61624.1 DNA topology modulation protein FlaR [Actinoplanes couchii]